MFEQKMKQRGFSGTTESAETEREKQGRAVAEKAAAEGIVLLKNDGVLPLAEGSSVALYGAGAGKTIKGGTGSGDVNDRGSVSIYEGMKNAGFTITDEDWIRDYDQIYQKAREDWRDAIFQKEKEDKTLGFFYSYASTPFHMPCGRPIDVAKASADGSDTAIYVLSRICGEGADRVEEKGDYYLTDEEHQMLSDICASYEKVIVVLNTGGQVDLSFMEEFSNIRALLTIAQPGMEGGTAFAEVISGRVNPSGHLTDTWAVHYADYPNAENYSHNNGCTDFDTYNEGIYVGYRYFDSYEIPVRYDFGYGLSYTTFHTEAGSVTCSEKGQETMVTVDATVTNTGDREGQEVVQVYVSLPEGKLEKEYRRLADFAKTRVLKPGERQKLRMTFPLKCLASYDPERAAWVLEKGRYGVFVTDGPEGISGAKLSCGLEAKEEIVLEQDRNICPTTEKIEEFHRDPAQIHRQSEKVSEKIDREGLVLYYLPENIRTRTVVYRENAAYTDPEAMKIAASLTTDQLLHLVCGDFNETQEGGQALGSAGMLVPGSAAQTYSGLRDRNIAPVVLADGPAGLRLMNHYFVRDGKIVPLPFEYSLERGFFSPDVDKTEGEKYYQYCTAIPTGTALAQTWNTELVSEAGEQIGKEMEEFGVTLWLAPGMCIHRNPLCGRNFEYYSEDPVVSGKMAAAVTAGVQRNPGVGTTVKHYICNNQEDNRMGSDSRLSERALREIYLRNFEIAIKSEQPMALMTSYNMVNGVHAANNRDLVTDVLRSEWGFEGVVMTDWTTTEVGDPACTASGCMRAGNDLVMPGAKSDAENMRAELKSGALDRNDVLACASRVLTMLDQSNAYEGAKPYGEK